MKKSAKKLKVVGLGWFYTNKVTAKDRGPILALGNIVRMYCYRFRTSVIGGWVSRYYAVVTADAKLYLGVKNFLPESEVCESVPVIKVAGEGAAWSRANRFIK